MSTMNGNTEPKSKPLVVDENEDGSYEQSAIDKLLNTLLCRSDYAKQKFEAKPVSLLQLFRFASTYDKFLLVIGVMLSVLCAIMQPVVFIIDGRIVNVFLLTKNFVGNDDFWYSSYKNIYILAIFGVCLVIITIAQYVCLKNAALNISRNIRIQYIRSFLVQDSEWLDHQKSGTIIAQLNENIGKIQDGIGDKLGMILRGIVMFVATVTMAFIFEWRVTLIMVGMGPCSAALLSIMARIVERMSGKQQEAIGVAGSIVEESIINVKTVAACNGQDEMLQRYSNALAKGRKIALKVIAFLGLFDGLFFFIMYIFTAFGFYYGAKLLQNKSIIDPGNVFIAVNLVIFGSYYLGILSPHLMAVMNARIAAAVIYKTIDRISPLDGLSKKGIALDNVKGVVEFNNVHFTYRTRKENPILNGLSWKAEQGETIALVGHSGCGKSTSVGLLTRLYECSSGSVMIDGLDVKKLNIHWLRNIVGVVEQEPKLFDGTIKENIRFGNPKLTDEEIIDACKLANAHDFIINLGKGYDTLLGAGGVQLSGGQKQRVAIARTLSRDPRILLLDEATSALDAESEIIVQNALKKASIGRTTIVIAHRLSTLRDSNRVIVINQGKVVETGSHKELAEMENGIYASLVKSQQFEEGDKKIKENHEEESSKVFERSNNRSTSRKRSCIAKSYFGRSSLISASFIETEDGTQFNNETKHCQGLWQLYANCHGSYLKLIFATILSALRGMELPCFAFIFKLAFDAFSNIDGEKMMKEMFIVFSASIIVGALTCITIFGATFTFGWAAECIIDKLRLRALCNMLYQTADYFDIPTRSHALTITRITTDAPNIKAALDSRMMQIVNNFASIIVDVILALFFSWIMGLIGTFIFISIAIIQFFAANAMQECNMRAIKKDLSGQLAIEIVERVRTIQLLTREESFHNMYDKQLSSILNLHKKTSWYEAILFAVVTSSMFFTDTASYGIGITLIYHGKLLPTDVFMSAMLIAMVGWALIMVSGCLNSFILAAPASDSIFNIINAKCPLDIDQGIRLDIQGGVQFRNVKFSYPTRKSNIILNSLSFTAGKGKTIAIVGPSGSGKSTVISLLERFYSISGGKLTIDGLSLNEICLKHLRDQMALVGQEPVLFSGTIKENILLGTKGKTMHDVQKACELANARDFIEAAPLKYETEVGERGTQLSGGQKQRIAIARALIRNPKILLLDEATSALDADSERAVQTALDKASGGRTCLIVAHRLSSIQYADQICFVENGQVVESGTHQELMEYDGKYADLIRKQDLKST